MMRRGSQGLAATARSSPSLSRSGSQGLAAMARSSPSLSRSGSQGLAAMARSIPSLSRSGAPLLPPGCHRRHLLCLPDQMQKVWLPESFRGARTSPGGNLAINGQRLFVDSEVTMVTDYLKQYPLIHPVPKDRLIVPDPSRPHFLKEDSNRLTWSGLDLVDSMHKCGMSTKGLFYKENVLVLPQQMTFGLKEVNLEDAGPLEMTERVDNYMEYVRFLEARVEDLHGAEAAGTLPPLFEGLKEAALDLLQNNQLLDLLLYYPALLPVHSKGHLYSRIYNLVVKRVPLLHGADLPVIGFVPDKKKKIPNPSQLCKRLLEAVPYSKRDPTYPKWGSVIAARNPDVFKCFDPRSKMNDNTANDLVAFLRHAPAHPLEESMVQLLTYLELIKQGKPLPPSSVLDSSTIKSAQSSTLSTVPPSGAEVVYLMDDSFPLYLPQMAKAFWTYGVYGWLDISGLFPPRGR